MIHIPYVFKIRYIARYRYWQGKPICVVQKTVYSRKAAADPFKEIIRRESFVALLPSQQLESFCPVLHHPLEGMENAFWIILFAKGPQALPVGPSKRVDRTGRVRHDIRFAQVVPYGMRC